MVLFTLMIPICVHAYFFYCTHHLHLSLALLSFYLVFIFARLQECLLIIIYKYKVIIVKGAKGKCQYLDLVTMVTIMYYATHATGSLSRCPLFGIVMCMTILAVDSL